MDSNVDEAATTRMNLEISKAKSSFLLHFVHFRIFSPRLVH